MKNTIVHRLEEAEKSLKNEAKERMDNDKDLRAHVDSECAQLRVYMDESTDTVRNLIGVREEDIALSHVRLRH